MPAIFAHILDSAFDSTTLLLVAVVVVISYCLVQSPRVRQACLYVFGFEERHFSVTSSCWSLCGECCGFHTGEWTRHLTDWRCCPDSFRGRNLLQFFGVKLGYVSRAVRLKHITVGDLMHTRHVPHPTLYVEIDGTNEMNWHMRTEVVRAANPLCTQFTSAVTIYTRNRLDSHVKLKVMQQNLLGSTTLAKVKIPSVVLNRWAANPKDYRSSKGVRLHLELGEDMDMEDEGHGRGAHKFEGWIFMQVEQIPEMKWLRTDSDNIFLPHPEGSPRPLSSENSEGPSKPLDPENYQLFNSCWGSSKPFEPEECDSFATNSDEFQDMYVDKFQDPKAKEAKLRPSSLLCHSFSLFLLFFVYGILQLIVSLCYEGYKEATVVSLHNATWGTDGAAKILSACGFKDNLFEQYKHASYQKLAHSVTSVDITCIPTPTMIQAHAVAPMPFAQEDWKWNTKLGSNRHILAIFMSPMQCHPPMVIVDIFADSNYVQYPMCMMFPLAIFVYCWDWYRAYNSQYESILNHFGEDSSDEVCTDRSTKWICC